MGHAPLPFTPVSQREDKKETSRIEREKRGLVNLAYEPYIETSISNCMNWVQPFFFVIVLIVALIIALLISGCAARHPRAGSPPPIPGCIGAVAYVSDGCRVSTYPDYIEVDCPNSTTKYMRCHNAE